MTLDEYKAMRIGDIQTELERRINLLISDYTQTKAMRRGLQLLAKGNNMTQAEKAELNGYAAQFATIDPIEAAAEVAKNRVRALTEIPVDDAYLLQW
jgi:hypothetical protein